MSIQNIIGSLGQGPSVKGHGLVVETEPAFAGTLRMGQVIKGKVMRHMEGTRYGVLYDGQERVVDSTVPLRTGEVIHGKVVALNEKVHLQRVLGDGSERSEASKAATVATSGKSSDVMIALQALFREYGATLPKGAETEIAKLLKGGERNHSMMLSALVVHKAGLPLRAELVRAVDQALQNGRGSMDASAQHDAPRLAKAPSSGVVGITAAAAQLANIISVFLDRNERAQQEELRYQDDLSREAATEERGPQMRDESAGGRAGDDWFREWGAGYRVLNRQDDGAVSPQVATFPIWFENQMVEVSVALFSQRKNAVNVQGLRHRRVVLALNTQHMGKVELIAQMTNRDLRLEIAAEQTSVTQFFAQHLKDIRQELEAAHWRVVDVSYTSKHRDGNGAMRAVVEHHISEDSLSRLM